MYITLSNFIIIRPGSRGFIVAAPRCGIDGIDAILSRHHAVLDITRDNAPLTNNNNRAMREREREGEERILTMRMRVAWLISRAKSTRVARATSAPIDFLSRFSLRTLRAAVSFSRDR